MDLENVRDKWVLIITDREELDDQNRIIIYWSWWVNLQNKKRKRLNTSAKWKPKCFVCSLVHKIGRKSDEGDFESYIEELK
jgi:type I restriction enzyme R subunit